jgi:ribosomal protein L11 methyltransferase
MDTLELKIDLVPREPWTGILIAELSELGFDGFMETKTGLLAYSSSEIDADKVLNLTGLLDAERVTYSIDKKIIPYQNWNAEWEAQFDPVYIDDKATIVAPFHTDSVIKGIKVLIEPQMSFGTGHHQTTWMMSRELFEWKGLPNRILDMGSGTGVLAIIAEKLGSEYILAVDIESEALKNIEHNAKLNACTRIEAKCGDIDILDRELPFGLILANINKNVLKNHMSRYSELLNAKGQLWLSGFFTSDVDELRKFAEELGFNYLEQKEREGWAILKLEK